MSKHKLDIKLEERWDDLVKAVAKGLKETRGGQSFEVFTERKSVSTGTDSVVIGLPKKGVFEATAPRSFWSRNTTPMLRFQTKPIAIERNELETDEGYKTHAASLVKDCTLIEHAVILFGLEGRPGLLTACKNEQPDEGNEANESPGEGKPFDTTRWVTVTSPGLNNITAKQQIESALLEGSKISYALRFEGQRPALLHVAEPWHVVRLADVGGTTVRLALESDFTYHIQGAAEGVDLLEVRLLDGDIVTGWQNKRSDLKKGTDYWRGRIDNDGTPLDLAGAEVGLSELKDLLDQFEDLRSEERSPAVEPGWHALKMSTQAAEANEVISRLQTINSSASMSKGAGSAP